MRKHGYIRITLKSDLCAGSGYAYSGLVDSDICYDGQGIPFIPARRIKGCLRDTAASVLGAVVDKDSVTRLFGVSGDSKARGIFVDNACVQGHEEIAREIDQINRHFGKTVISPQNVLEAFSHVQAQTSMDNGVAKENSLRYTRVTNRFSPLDGQEMVFIAPVSIPDDDKLQEDLGSIVRATRNIGYKRNRGCGSVRCELVIPENRETYEEKKEPFCAEDDGSGKVKISYVIQNTLPLMLSGEDNSVSDSMIKGQSVLGYFAGIFLEQGGDPESEAFRDLFLNGKTIFTDAVPYMDNKKYYPAPEYIRRLKKTKKYVNTEFDKEAAGISQEDDYYPKSGNQPQRLKGKYVFMDENGDVDALEVGRVLTYHHSHSQTNRDGREGLLYDLEAVKEGQFFAGEIITEQRYGSFFMDVLSSGQSMYFGKSKSAQYGKCRVVSAEAGKAGGDVAKFGEGQWILVDFLSDGIFADHKGSYTVYLDQVKELLAEDLRIEYDREEDELKDSSSCQFHSYIQTKTIKGYNSKWNMKRQPVPAIAAGSTIAYKLKKPLETDRNFAGVRNLEGFGMVRIHGITGGYRLNAINREAVGNTKAEVKHTGTILTGVMLKRIKDKMIWSIISRAKSPLDISASSLGRLTLMVREAQGKYRNDPEKAFADLGDRVDSIKTDSTRKSCMNVLKQFGNRDEKSKKWMLGEAMNWNLWGNKLSDRYEEVEILQELGISGWEKQLTAMWYEIMMAVLVAEKYDKKKEA